MASKNTRLTYWQRWSACSIVSQMIEIAHDRNPYAGARFPEPDMIMSIDSMMQALKQRDFSDYIPELEEIRDEARAEGDDDELMRVSALLEDIDEYLESF